MYALANKTTGFKPFILTHYYHMAKKKQRSTSSRFVDIDLDRRRLDVLLTVDWQLLTSSVADPYGVNMFLTPEALVEFRDALNAWVEEHLESE